MTDQKSDRETNAGQAKQLPRAMPSARLERLSTKANGGGDPEAAETLADVIVGEIYWALTDAYKIPIGASLRFQQWLPKVVGPTIFLASLVKARTDKDWDIAGTLLAYAVLRCVAEAGRTGGCGAEFRASDAEVATALGVKAHRVRRARERLRSEGGLFFITIEGSQRTRARYSLGTIPAMASATDRDVVAVTDWLEREDHLVPVKSAPAS